MSKSSVALIIASIVVFVATYRFLVQFSESDRLVEKIKIEGADTGPRATPQIEQRRSGSESFKRTEVRTNPEIRSDRGSDSTPFERDGVPPRSSATSAHAVDASSSTVIDSTESQKSTDVIGHPFPVSKSVAAGCKAITCPELDQALAQFSQEPREIAWASQMEEKLRDFVIGHLGYAVRNVECRTTLCVMEVTSVQGSFPDGTILNDTFRDTLDFQAGAFGFERDPPSARVTVTLTQYQRLYPKAK